MNKYTITIFTSILLLFCNYYKSQAQTFNDALRYSQNNISGTARFMATGGSMGALGADMSMLYTNPAGLAAFRKSELVISPGFWNVRTDSRIDAAGSSSFLEKSNKIGLGNVGLVVASNPSQGNWSTVNFSIGLQRIADYNQEFYFQGRTRGSIVDRFTALANGNTPAQLDDFEAGLAFDAGAIYGPSSEGTYFNDLESDYELEKTQYSVIGGRANELSLALSGNMSEKLMIGMAIGIPFYSFNWDKTYEENDNTNELLLFDKLEFRERLNASGTGFNAKFGAIVMPLTGLRIGIAVHTPTFLRITENFNNNLKYTFSEPNQNPRTLSAESPQGRFEYKVTTPWRTIASAGYIIPGFGFVSAEAEYVDYKNAAFKFINATSSDKAYERELNSEVKNRLGSAFNLRAGIEYAKSIWRVRGGFMLEGSPFRGDDHLNPGYTFGVGIRENLFFLDLAYVHRTRNELYSPYQIENNFNTNVLNEVTIGQLMLTIGFKI
jgi:hypothetical protein